MKVPFFSFSFLFLFLFFFFFFSFLFPFLPSSLYSSPFFSFSLSLPSNYVLPAELVLLESESLQRGNNATLLYSKSNVFFSSFLFDILFLFFFLIFLLSPLSLFVRWWIFCCTLLGCMSMILRTYAKFQFSFFLSFSFSFLFFSLIDLIIISQRIP